MVKTVRLADIAQKAGVSVVTVSKALSGQKGVSEEMRAKIKTLAGEMGYTPVHAKQSGSSKSYTVGVITFERYFAKFASFYWKMYQELATQAVKQNCFSMLEVIANFDEDDLTLPKLLESGRVDGIIVIGKPKKEYLKTLYQNKKVPMVFLDFYDDELVVDSVISAGFYGMYRMTEYLIKKGHTDIAYVGTVMYTESITDRYFGYCKALLEHGIERRPEWTINDRAYTDGIMGMGYKFAFSENKMPTAFVCNNDITAYALIKQLEERGYRVPEDISVVGYDDYLNPEFGDSRITTYSVDMGAMTKVALTYMVKRIENADVGANTHVVSGKLIERGTVKEITQAE
ncbi:MAG: LacI family DNA-binding transcriptional regulator [Bacillus sp. (in: Bacteria)]|nr:LacI family DNA-binding transcriptional regulator [Bacillus sp. (in: firmicutes)]MCM1427188.1 LacI family DNA-binding transcriptional regulator [Eubacterium sp.]